MINSQNYGERVTQVYFSEPWEDDVLEFRLLYWGQVLASTNTKRRKQEKQQMRQQFHPQLKRLWGTRKSLRRMAFEKGIIGETLVSGENRPETGEGSFYELGIEKMANERPFNGFRFIPLVTESLCLRCNIDILFLRHEDTGNLIFQGGDIDGRVKTIFDALRIPQPGELDAGYSPSTDEDPFFVLLEDDKLISQVSVTTDQLLMLPGGANISPNDAFLQIKIELNTTAPAQHGWVFEGR